jgi:cysteine desulfurase
VHRSYFDHNATTPVSPEVLETLLPAMAEVYGNASSIHHHGQIAKQRLEMARRQVAAFLHCDAREIVFTSGGTESDNLAIFGVAGRGGHVITTTIEHPAVLNVCGQLDVTFVGVGSDGVVDPDDVRRALRLDTVLISVMHANNELGTIQPIQEIASIAKEAGVTFHVDGVQAAGKIPVDLKALGVDLYSISGHKLYAPKGIGALYVRTGVKLRPLLFGGRHERERRPGTENVPGAVALGRAAELASPLASEMRDRLEQGILGRVPSAGVNGSRAQRVPNTTNVYFDGIEGEAMVISLDLKGFAVSSGSACSSGAVEPSHVLMAIGLNRDRAKSSVRFSLGHGNTVEQVDALVDAVAQSAAHLRKLSPTYA